MWHHLLIGSLLTLAMSGAGKAILCLTDHPYMGESELSVEMAKNSRQPFHRGSGRRTLLPYVYSLVV